MSLFTDILYFVTSGLLIPCIAYLLTLLLQSLIAAGKHMVQKRHAAHSTQHLVEQLLERDPQKLSDAIKHNNKISVEYAPLQTMVVRIQTTRSLASADFMVSEYEVEADKELSRFANYAKLGPIVGLMGTLIPMGPALQGLASGDIAQLANQMQVAFTTTVVGLLVGVIGFLLYQYQRRQVERELSALELLVALQFGEK